MVNTFKPFNEAISISIKRYIFSLLYGKGSIQVKLYTNWGPKLWLYFLLAGWNLFNVIFHKSIYCVHNDKNFKIITMLLFFAYKNRVIKRGSLVPSSVRCILIQFIRVIMSVSIMSTVLCPGIMIISGIKLEIFLLPVILGFVKSRRNAGRI